VSAAEGQAARSAISRRIACAKDQGFCAYHNGMPVPHVDIAAPALDDMNRAMGALRDIQSVCRQPAPAG
jgi:hypothetical protein